MWPFVRKTENVGQRGERLARQHLRRLGCKVLAVNYRCPSGELDLIVLDRSTRKAGGAETIVFVEVKTRTSARFTQPQSAVDAEKRRRMRKAAAYYLKTRDTRGFAVRYDIVAIVLRDGGPPEINHLPGAG